MNLNYQYCEQDQDIICDGCGDCDKIPVFVYGTLMTGESNWSIIRPFVYGTVPASLPNYEMVSVNHYPGIIEAEEFGVVFGQLMYIKKSRYWEAIKRLDQLEGFQKDHPKSSLFLRKKVTVITENGVLCGAYVYTFNRSIKGLKKIKHGNWKIFMEERR